ncbi:MAG TPA: hypothetical protein VE400_17640, partial [Mycobacterium sp.]|nr:hypothetical protein [Mycobacterium sp.]
MGVHSPVAFCQRVAENLFLSVQLLSHVAPLGSLPGEDKYHTRSGTASSDRQSGPAFALPVGGERLGQLSGVATNYGQPVVVVVTT